MDGKHSYVGSVASVRRISEHVAARILVPTLTQVIHNQLSAFVSQAAFGGLEVENGPQKSPVVRGGPPECIEKRHPRRLNGSVARGNNVVANRWRKCR
jgi:hypothetical protein